MPRNRSWSSHLAILDPFQYCHTPQTYENEEEDECIAKIYIQYLRPHLERQRICIQASEGSEEMTTLLF